jgi:hypothetical protein
MPEEVYDGATEHREHRVGAWLVLVVGIVGFVLGLVHMHGRITGAFAARSTYKSPEQIETERIEGLKTKDTDADGITDFDETYVFKTSPYLEDSDSDGLSDKKELAAGGNPNCPVGKECGPLGASVTAGLNSTTAPVDEAALISGEAAADQQEIMDQLTNLSADEVRQILIQSGIKEEQLAGIDDETLMQLYRESLKEAQEKQAQEESASPQ